MRRRRMPLWTLLLTGVSLFCPLFAKSLSAELTAQHQKELAEVRRSLLEVTSIIRRGQLDEAQQLIDEADARVKQIVKEAQLTSNSPAIVGLERLISSRRHAVELARDPQKAKTGASVSFVKHVAPILNARCVACHSDEASGKLRLNSYAGIKKGGQSGPLLHAGRADRSLFLLRLCTPLQKLRMPKNEQPLSPAEINVLALWVNQGAKFDGEDEDAELAELLKPKEELPPIEGFEPTGKETVSFKKDIAPWMVVSCLRCHSGKEPQGGLSLETYEGLMRGGESGPVVIPGDAGKSLIYQLVGSFDESKRMPANREKLLRENWDDLGRWIHEGAKYDGGDPRLLLRALNPSQGELQAAELAGFNDDDFEKYRAARTGEQWQRAFSDQQPQSKTTADLILFGNVSAERLTEVERWAEPHLRTLRKLFELDAESPLWKGKLAVFVLKDRGDFETLNESITSRRVLPGSFADVQVTPNFADALVTLQDTGDETDGQSPTLQFTVLETLTRAYLATSEAGYPQWFSLGLGPALAAAKADRKDAYVETLREAAIESVAALSKPTDVFQDGVFFSSDESRPVGFTLVEFLFKRGGGERQLAAFLHALRDGGDVANSLRLVYRAEPEPIAQNFLATLKVRRK